MSHKVECYHHYCSTSTCPPCHSPPWKHQACNIRGRFQHSQLWTSLKIEPIVKYLATLNAWFKSRNLAISPPKTTVTLFTTGSNDCSTVLNVEIDGEKVLFEFYLAVEFWFNQLHFRLNSKKISFIIFSEFLI